MQWRKQALRTGSKQVLLRKFKKIKIFIVEVWETEQCSLDIALLYRTIGQIVPQCKSAHWAPQFKRPGNYALSHNACGGHRLSTHGRLATPEPSFYKWEHHG